MAITTMDQLVSALGTSKDQKLFFASATNAAGGWLNLNISATPSFGTMAAPAAATSGGTAYSQSGAPAGFPLWSAAAGGQTSYIGRIGSTFATSGTIHVYDLAWACTGFNGTLTTAQTTTSPVALPSRYTGGAGLECWIFDTTALGATASNITVQYTNQSATAGRNTQSTAMVTSFPANRMFQVPLQSGDTGIQSVQSVTLSASTGTAGSFGVMLMKRLCSFGAPVPNVGNSADFAALGFPAVDDNACLLFVHQATTTSSGIIMGQLSIVQG